jgi:hypothetical protein
MKRLGLAATAAVVALVLTGCSPGVLPGGIPGAGGSAGSSAAAGAGGATAAAAASGNGSTATITGDDLVAILKKVAAERHVPAKIIGTAQSKAFVKADISGPNSHTVTGNLTDGGGKFTPASCAKPLNSLGILGESMIAQDGWEGAAMVVGDDQISLGSAPSAADAAALVTQTSSLVKLISSQCPMMSITNKAAYATFVVKPVSASSDSSETVAYQEVEGYQDGTSDTGETVVAVYGNLYIAVISATPKASELQANVNAVIAAAKG